MCFRGPSSTAFPGTLARCWVRTGTARHKPGLRYRILAPLRWWLNPLCHSTSATASVSLTPLLLQLSLAVWTLARTTLVCLQAILASYQETRATAVKSYSPCHSFAYARLTRTFSRLTDWIGYWCGAQWSLASQPSPWLQCSTAAACGAAGIRWKPASWAVLVWRPVLFACMWLFVLQKHRLFNWSSLWTSQFSGKTWVTAGPPEVVGSSLCRRDLNRKRKHRTLPPSLIGTPAPPGKLWAAVGTLTRLLESKKTVHLPTASNYFKALSFKK